MKSRWLSPVLAFVALVFALWIAVFEFEVTTDITHFLPAGDDEGQVRLSRALAQSELTRTLVLTVKGADEEQTLQATADVARRLAKNPNVAWLRQGVDGAFEEVVYQLYYPRRLLFFSSSPDDELPQMLTVQGIREALAELKNELRLAGGPVRSIAPSDPFLAFPRRLSELGAAQQGELELRGGQFVTEEGRRGVIFLGSRSSAFETNQQRRLQAAIGNAVEATHQAHEDRVVLEQSGAGRFAIASEDSIKSDIARISLVSTVGLLLLFIVLFRRFSAVILVVLPLATGIIGALALSLLIFERLHGLTLAFGATLIGVCIDFSVHFQTHQVLVPHRKGPLRTLRRILPALVLGALTTVAGLAGLAWTSLPGIREIAVFSSLGVVLALAATAMFLPSFVPARQTAPSLARLALFARQALNGMERRRRTVALLPVGAILLSVVFLPRLRWNDDITAFRNLDASIQAEHERVQRQVGQMEGGRVVVARGTTEEEALQGNDRALRIVQQAQADGLLDDFRSLHSFLRSERTQERNWQHFAGLIRDREAFAVARDGEGFRDGAFSPFFEALDDEPPSPLRFADLAASPLADVVRPFRVTLDGDVAFLTFVRGVREPVELKTRLATVPGVQYFDQLGFLNDAYRTCRSRTFQSMVVGLILVTVMVLLRYRRWRPAAAAVAPSILAGVTTLALAGAAGYPVNLFHLIGLLLVLSMGVDYGVFLTESRHSPRELDATAVAILVACLSTMCAFGLLALSSNPALRALGLTTAVGVGLSLLLAPTAVLLVHPPRGHGAKGPAASTTKD